MNGRGSLVVSAGGVVSGAVASSGGELVLSGSASAIVVTVLSGATLSLAGQAVFSGQSWVDGTVSATTVIDGVTVSSGASISVANDNGERRDRYRALRWGDGLHPDHRGRAVVVSGALGSSGMVAFSGAGGELVLDNAAAFAGEISGLTMSSQKIDLVGFAYGAGETVPGRRPRAIRVEPSP